jgi:hypothetical protein
MKQWYLFYAQGGDTILHQAGAELQKKLRINIQQKCTKLVQN